MKIQNKILAGAVALATASMSAHVYADTTEDLINALVTKGVLTEDEGALLSRSHGKKMKNTPTIKNSGGKFTLQSADGKNSIAITGRMHFDMKASSIDEDDISGGTYTEYDRDGKSISSPGEFEMRRARLGIKGKLDKIWKYNVVLNAAGKGKKGMDTAELTFAPSKAFNFKMGQFKQAFNLEGLTSSNDIDFNERSWINQISPHKKLGIAANGAFGKKNAGTWMVTRYQENFKDDDIEVDANMSARVTYDFAKAAKMKNKILHFGISGFSEDYSQTPKTSSNGIDPSVTGHGYHADSPEGTTHAKLFSFKSAGRGLKPLASLQLQGHGLTNGGASQKGKVNVDVESSFIGLEAIIANGPFKVQAEYTDGDFEGSNPGYTNTAEADIRAYYLTASYILTGEKYSKSYKGGKMKGIKVNNPYDMSSGKGIGMWEVAARYQKLDISNININQGDMTSGETRFRGTSNCGSVSATYTSCTNGSSGADQWSLGLKWKANKNVQFKASLEHTKFDDGMYVADVKSPEELNSETLGTVRMQYMF